MLPVEAKPEAAVPQTRYLQDNLQERAQKQPPHQAIDVLWPKQSDDHYRAVEYGSGKGREGKALQGIQNSREDAGYAQKQYGRSGQPHEVYGDGNQAWIAEIARPGQPGDLGRERLHE